MEETLMQAMDIKESLNDTDLDCCSSYDLRTRTVIKQPRKKLLQAQNSSSDISKSPRLEKSGTYFNEKIFGMNRPPCEEDVDEEDSSEESVSMLQGLYQNNSKNGFPELIETCMDAELDVISIYTDEEIEKSVGGKTYEKEFVLKIENSTQTDFSLPLMVLSQPKEIEVAKHTNFIRSVVKLKNFLSSKKPISDKKIWSVLNNTMKSRKMIAQEFYQYLEVDEAEEHCQSVPKETIGYLIRSSDVEHVFCETVQAVLQHLEYALGRDFLKTASCWKNSIYEMAVDILSEAVDCEAGIWKMADSFLCEKIASILKDGGKSKNFVLESKAKFIICFCQSTHLSYTAINFIIKKIEKLKIIKLNTGSLTEKISWSYLTKNSFFLLRILESSLDKLKTKIGKGKVQEVLMKKPEQNNYNVLEMWKKHWNKNEVLDGQKTDHDLEVVVSQWCTNLDGVLLHCMNHIPVLSMAVKRCGILAKEILEICHPELMESRTDMN